VHVSSEVQLDYFRDKSVSYAIKDVSVESAYFSEMVVLVLIRHLSNFESIYTSLVFVLRLVSGWETTATNRLLVINAKSFIIASMSERSYNVKVHLRCAEGAMLNMTED
jgi:hypothetical protein